MTPTGSTTSALLVMLSLCAISITPGPAAAADFAGTWAADLESCKKGQDTPEAPLVLTSKGYDQHEAHCDFKGLEAKGGDEWSGKASCTVEGDKQSFDVKLIVSGNTLTLTENGASRDLLRCP